MMCCMQLYLEADLFAVSEIWACKNEANPTWGKVKTKRMAKDVQGRHQMSHVLEWLPHSCSVK